MWILLADFFVISYLVLQPLGLILGVAADRLWGDPSGGWHPIVWFGRAIAAYERWANRSDCSPCALRCRGAALAVLYPLGVFLLSCLVFGGGFVLIFAWDGLLAWLGLLLSVFVVTGFVFYGLAGTTLRYEVRMVFEAADRSLDEGRRQVGRIVGRDTEGLSAQEVRLAALETLSENLNDGVVAPLFYFLLGLLLSGAVLVLMIWLPVWFWWLGFLIIPLPSALMLTYKMVNTLDSMVGYRTDRYLDFGRWSARLDDAWSYLPARLTALLLVTAAWRWDLWSFVGRYGRAHLSPNSGYPEAAMAGILRCRFGGSHDYFGQEVAKPYIGETDREVGLPDCHTALRLALRAERLMLAFVLLASLCLAATFLSFFG